MATGVTTAMGSISALYSLRGNRPRKSPRLASTTSTVLLDTLTRVYSGSPRSSVEGELLQCKGCLMAKGFRKDISSTHKRAGTISGGFRDFGTTYDLRGYRRETVHSHGGRPFFFGIRGCIFSATYRTPRSFSRSLRISVQMMPLPRW